MEGHIASHGKAEAQIRPDSKLPVYNHSAAYLCSANMVQETIQRVTQVSLSLSTNLPGDLRQGLWSLRGLIFSSVNWNQESLSYLPYQTIVKGIKQQQVINGESKVLTLEAENSWHYYYLRLGTMPRPPQQRSRREQAQANESMDCMEL